MRTDRLAKMFALTLAVVLSTMCVEAAGEPTMAQPNTLTAVDTLEKFNDPRNFMATRSTFDVGRFKKATQGYDEYKYTNEYGIRVRQVSFNEIYQEELSRPESHYEYVYVYDKSGRLKVMGVRFCRDSVGENISFDEKGNIVKRRNLDQESGFLPIENLRERFLKDTGVNIYDKEKVFYVYHASHERKPYYEIFVYKEGPNSPLLTVYLLDAATGEILFQVNASRGRGGITPLVYEVYKAQQLSGEKKP